MNREVVEVEAKKIIFPEYDRDAWAQGDRRTAATDVSIDKHVSQDLSDLAPDVEVHEKTPDKPQICG